MTQQYTFGSASDHYKKRLFVDTGGQFMEVKARIIEPYSPPAPVTKLKETQIVNAPSNFEHRGIASYKAHLRLLFDSKDDFAEYMLWSGWTHKFYDEKGSIYLGAAESIKPSAVEASKRYVVEIDLSLIKKDAYDRKSINEFQDIDNLQGDSHWSKTDIVEMADLGLVTVISRDGQPVLYFRPNDYITRAEYVTFLNRTRRLMEQIIRE